MNMRPEIIKNLICLKCLKEPSKFLVSEKLIVCQNCDHSYQIINGIPACFCPDDEGLVDFSEVDVNDRRNFIQMKQIAYFKKSFLQKLYTYYHVFAGSQRTNNKNPMILDIGFGMGEHSPFIHEKEIKEGRFVALDLDRFKLELAKENLAELPVLQANAFRLPFTSNSFDIVQMLAFLEHFTSSELSCLLSEVKRVLKPGGKIIACYPAEGSLLLKLGQTIIHFFLNLKTGFNLNEGAIHSHKSNAVEIEQVLRQNFKRKTRVLFPTRIPSINFNLFVNETYTYQ